MLFGFCQIPAQTLAARVSEPNILEKAVGPFFNWLNGQLNFNESFIPMLAVMVVLCPLCTFLFKVFFQFFDKKVMWVWTDRVSVGMMILACFLSSIILTYALKHSRQRDYDPELGDFHRSLSVSWMKFGPTGENFVKGISADPIHLEDFEDALYKIYDEQRGALSHVETVEAANLARTGSHNLATSDVREIDQMFREEEDKKNRLLTDSEKVAYLKEKAEENRGKYYSYLCHNVLDRELSGEVLEKFNNAFVMPNRLKVFARPEGGLNNKFISSCMSEALRLAHREAQKTQLYLNEEQFHKHVLNAELDADALAGIVNTAFERSSVFPTNEKSRLFNVVIGVEINTMTALMLFMVTFICSLIHLYSVGYMQGDPRYPRFFSYISLFSFAMLGLVISDNILMVYVFWEIMGLCSYLLIGFYFAKESAAKASLKAFMVTRIGDVGMFIGIMMLYFLTGTFSFNEMYDKVQPYVTNWKTVDPGFGVMLTIMGVLLFLGPVGKSAQFPLHVWLPDAMEGPTPVSAMIHAATMVSAGVFLCGKFYPLFTPDALIVVTSIGAFTALFAASIALVQNDIKKVLAYSTISQLGFMITAIGLGAWQAAMFHMLTHAFFKACLFLGSGSVIHAVHTQDMREMGGLWKKMPVTYTTFLMATIAIAGLGIPLSLAGFIDLGFAGFFSKDQIMAAAYLHGMNSGYWHGYVVFGTLLLAAMMTCFYMFRLVFMTFHGKAKDHDKYHHAHESPWTMALPLVLLSIFAVLGGYFKFNDIVKAPVSVLAPTDEDSHDGENSKDTAHKQAKAVLPSETILTVGAAVAEGGHAGTASHGEGHGEHGGHDKHHTAHHNAMVVTLSGAFLSLILAFMMYTIPAGARRPRISPQAISLKCGWIYHVLVRKYYMDEIYQRVFVDSLLFMNRVLDAVDKYIVDGIVVNSRWVVLLISQVSGWLDKHIVDGIVNYMAHFCHEVGGGFSRIQDGRIQHYIIGIVVCCLVIAVLCVTGFGSFLASGPEVLEWVLSYLIPGRNG